VDSTASTASPESESGEDSPNEDKKQSSEPDGHQVASVARIGHLHSGQVAPLSQQGGQNRKEALVTQPHVVVVNQGSIQPTVPSLDSVSPPTYSAVASSSPTLDNHRQGSDSRPVVQPQASRTDSLSSAVRQPLVAAPVTQPAASNSNPYAHLLMPRRSKPVKKAVVAADVDQTDLKNRLLEHPTWYKHFFHHEGWFAMVAGLSIYKPSNMPSHIRALVNTWHQRHQFHRQCGNRCQQHRQMLLEYTFSRPPGPAAQGDGTTT